MLDEAVSRFVSAYTEYLSAKEALRQALIEAGASKRTAHNFIKNLEDGVRLGKLGVEPAKPAPRAKAGPEREPEPEPDCPQEPVVGAEPVVEKGNGSTVESLRAGDFVEKVDRWALKDELKDGEFVTDGKHYYYYKLDGKVYKRKALPLVEYNNLRLYFNEHREKFYLHPVGKREGVRYVSEDVAVSWMRDILKKLELDEISAGDVLIYEPFARAMMPKMRPLARDALNELIRSWRAKGGGAG